MTEREPRGIVADADRVLKDKAVDVSAITTNCYDGWHPESPFINRVFEAGSLIPDGLAGFLLGEGSDY